jgi:hypothetical protein
VPSRHSKWNIQRITTLSPFTNTGRMHFDVYNCALASTLRPFAT